MQIAQVVPKTRTQKGEIFDYAIPPALLPQIRPGILVEIPFHGRKLEGIIINLKSKSQIPNPKSILKIIDPIPIVDEIHIKLARWMSDYYLAPFGKTLFENIVPPAKRVLKKERTTTDETSETRKYPTFDARASKVGKKYLVVGNFESRLKFYLKAINLTLAQNRSIIILVPDISLTYYFQKYLKMPCALIHSKMTKTQRWLAWEKTRQGKTKIIIGSQSALFAPVKNLGLIIIDQEENEAFKNERSPRYHAVRVAEFLSKLTAVNLLLGSLAPRVETYFQALENKYILKKAESKSPPQVSVVNTSGKFQTISPPLQEKIEENLRKSKKIILVLNRKGEGRQFVCTDCHWVALCENCGLPLIPQDEKLICFRCQKDTLEPQECPKCHNVHLKLFGLGTKKLEKFVRDFWPKARVAIIENKNNESPITIRTDWNIAIATTYALKFKLPSIGLVGIINAEQDLNFPDFHSSEKTFQRFYKFLKVGEQGIIQTNLDNNPTIAALACLDYEKFFLNELAERKKCGFPPFVKLTRLLYKNQDEKKCQKESQKIYKNLSQIIREQKYPSILISSPAPAFFRKKRNLYRWQIIIKTPKHIAGKKFRPLKNFLKTLPKGWTIDVDPVEML